VLRFGTDGVRGDADTELTDAFVAALGRSVAQVLGSDHLLIGRDTRASGARIERALAAGCHRAGVEATRLGVLPTPGIAFHAARLRTPAAIVSASHNPWSDNGVKVVGADGGKLSDDAEIAIEDALESLAVPDDLEDDAARAPSDVDFPVISEWAEPYIRHVVDALDGRRVDGLSVVLDCANGATFGVGGPVLARAGATVDVISAEPTGRNINDGCGSTHPDTLQAAVVARGADVGLAIDGDGDRVIVVDERGALVDGDQIMVMIALDLHQRGLLRNDAIAVTVMTNLGLRRALHAAGIEVVETPVGDRHVVAAMRAGNLVLGGEQSGHIVFADRATTGDGLLTGLMVCDLVRRSHRPLSELAGQMARVPQLLVNVRVARRVDLEQSAVLQRAIGDATDALGETGRVLVRSSGTEPLVRIMVEAVDQARADAIAAGLRSVVETELGSGATT
jgi:phosphoglucosamine mutase